MRLQWFSDAKALMENYLLSVCVRCSGRVDGGAGVCSSVLPGSREEVKQHSDEQIRTDKLHIRGFICFYCRETFQLGLLMCVSKARAGLCAAIF